ncbi:unnamed protein product [Blepharisma stoltei]|uniref:EF-hand domain-containing protein n=1 Tax=Blepharisma stoltei TaxID=1481888 RepID=A0AAU9J066_9CILI|nr:unnamed protein product [Blepharisma stoltei]
MEKLRESVYFRRTDLVDECYKYDKGGTGNVTREQFTQALKLSRLKFSEKEIQEIALLAPKDPAGKIKYRDFQKTMQSQQNNRNPEIYSEESYPDKVKVAHALKDQIELVTEPEVSEAMFVSFIRRTWIRIEPHRLREIWSQIPHRTSELKKWVERYVLNDLPDAVLPPDNSTNIANLPIILTKLRNIATLYGVDIVMQSVKAKSVLFREDLWEIVRKFKLGATNEEFDKFREWAIQQGLMKLYDIELGMDSTGLAEYFSDIEVLSTQEDLQGNSPALTQILKKAVGEMITERLLNVKRALEANGDNHYIEEIRLREVLAYSLPQLSNENISLIINSLKYTILPSYENPFRRIYIPELMSLINGSDYELSFKKKEETKIDIEEQKPIDFGNFVVKPKDWNWEIGVLRKIYCRYRELIANLKIADWEKKGFLTLEQFHWALKVSMDWLTDEEIFFLVGYAIREAGCLDEKRTGDARRDLYEYQTTSVTISRAMFPEGEQYNISYLYFMVSIERLMKMNELNSEQI